MTSFPAEHSEGRNNVARREKRNFQPVEATFWDHQSLVTQDFNSAQQLLDAMPGFVWKTDENGMYTDFNQSWLEFRGRTAEEEKGLGWIEGIHPDDLKSALDVHAEAAAKELPFARQFRLMGADRQYHWIRDAGRPMFENEILAGYCGTATDHTAETLNAHALRDSLDRQETLLKEAHHRIKNNLQILSTLLHLQAQQVQDSNVRSILEDCLNRVSVIVLLHQKLFQNELTEELNFSEYIRDLVAAISRSYGNEGDIQIHLDVETVALHADKVIACGLIITELISNSFKHAFPGYKAGKAHLRFYSESSDYVLEVSDEGIGMPAELKLSSSKSLGLKLVFALVSQLRGHYDVRRDNGTHFTIRFPRT